ncbi:MAG TPA: radical SAM protein [Candidatus Polarisedimenticolia bacterium]|nr:radical SAM protein [Candidatus Polarisedimenticolia bacterium]
MIINEIFHSIQGESTRAGLPCTFVRLTACNLRCGYCDSAHAFHEGKAMRVSEVVGAVERFGCRFVTITGGEPLLQEEVYPLMTELAAKGYDMQVETSGSVDISKVDPRVRVILDIKTPGSGEARANRWENIEKLKQGDEVKFVLTGRSDYDWAKETLRARRLPEGIPILMSPAHGVLEPRQLAEWMTTDGSTARLHLQIHKYIWGPDCRGV